MNVASNVGVVVVNGPVVVFVLIELFVIQQIDVDLSLMGDDICSCMW